MLHFTLFAKLVILYLQITFEFVSYCTMIADCLYDIYLLLYAYSKEEYYGTKERIRKRS